MTIHPMIQHPVVQRTRLRFPEMARQGWLYLTHTFRTPGQDGSSGEETYLRHGRPFLPEAVRICPDLPAFGVGELAHTVLPGVAPVFVLTGRQDLREALQAGDDGWQETLATSRDYFAAVTAEQFPSMARQGWLWVMDLCLPPSQTQPARAEVQRACRHGLSLDFLQPTEACASPDLARGSGLCGTALQATLVPVFVRTAQPLAQNSALAALCACTG